MCSRECVIPPLPQYREGGALTSEEIKFSTWVYKKSLNLIGELDCRTRTFLFLSVATFVQNEYKQSHICRYIDHSHIAS